jgi:peptidoglycan/xylan/chitin deacetylase (PgdA/CDA1 family)
MAGPIYKLWMARFDRSIQQLSAEEQQALMDKVQQALKQVGGKTIVMCASGWANEQWQFFGVEEFPDIEAVQKQAGLHMEIGWSGYGESFSLLGIPFSPG